MSGIKIGRWTLISQTDKNGEPAWLCKCECGTERVVHWTSLRRGRSISCGCSKRKKITKEQVLEARKRARLKWLYGLSPEQIQEVADRQNNACAICLKHKKLF